MSEPPNLACFALQQFATRRPKRAPPLLLPHAKAGPTVTSFRRCVVQARYEADYKSSATTQEYCLLPIV